MEWQPIETAPKDLKFLVVDVFGFMAVCKMIRGKLCLAYNYHPFDDATHWMPLPKPPQIKS